MKILIFTICLKGVFDFKMLNVKKTPPSASFNQSITHNAIEAIAQNRSHAPPQSLNALFGEVAKIEHTCCPATFNQINFSLFTCYKCY